MLHAVLVLKAIFCPNSQLAYSCIFGMSQEAISDTVMPDPVAKRQRLLQIYRGTDEYQIYVQHKQENDTHKLPVTPRPNVAKREWEKTFYQWKTCLKSFAGQGPLQGSLWI